jgi:hypothetical protein
MEKKLLEGDFGNKLIQAKTNMICALDVACCNATYTSSAVVLGYSASPKSQSGISGR